MARQTLVLDASVGVKWFVATGEADVPQARTLMKAHAQGEIALLVPDLFFHEVCNALVHKKSVTAALVEEALTTLFALDLVVFTISEQRLLAAAGLARKFSITAYDAFYVALAIENDCPLVTANPRRQKVAGCRILTLDEWGRQDWPKS